MAKVSAKCGLTLKISKESQYEFIRPEIEISDIDSEGDIKSQLDLAIKALNDTWDVVTEQIGDKVLADVRFDVDQELKTQLKKKFLKIDTMLEKLKEEILKVR